MANRSLRKRIASVVLSAAVAFTSMPAAVFAADLSDSVIAEQTEESEQEEALEVEENEETSGEEADVEISDEIAVSDEENDAEAESVPEAEEDFSDEAAGTEDSNIVSVAGANYAWTKTATEGYTQIGNTGVYYKPAENSTGLSGSFYGKATLSYTDFYSGDTSQAQYDAITSATNKKFNIFQNESTTEVTDDGYQITGVKNVSVAVDAQIYAEAQILKAADSLPADGVYAKAAGIELNEAPATAVGQYKTLNSDGTYRATNFDVKATVTDADADITAPSIWGDYMLVVKENSTKYLRNTRSDEGFAVGGNILGAIVETASGKKVGLRHTYEIWVQPYELAFSKNAGLAGEKIANVTYITPDGAYVYTFGDNAPLVKAQPTEAQKISASFVEGSTSQIAVSGLENFKNPKVSVYYTTGMGHGKKTTYVVNQATADKGVVTFDEKVARAEDEAYVIKVESDDCVDVETDTELITLSLKSDSATIKVGEKTAPQLEGVNYGTLSYTSSNEKVASVDEKGTVTAKAAGSAQITISSSRLKTPLVFTVTVKAAENGGTTVTPAKPTAKPTTAPSVKKAEKTGITATVGQVYVGKKAAVKVTKTNVTGKVKFKSSNKKVATVNKKGIVTGKKAGTAKITVTVGKYKKVLTVKVKKPSFKLAKSSAKIKKGKTTTIKVKAAPVSKVTYKSSNKKVATVTKKGVVKAKKKGTATITVKCNGITRKFKVTVK